MCGPAESSHRELVSKASEPTLGQSCVSSRSGCRDLHVPDHDPPAVTAGDNSTVRGEYHRFGLLRLEGGDLLQSTAVQQKDLFATTCGQETSIGAQSRRSKRPLLGSKNNRGPLRKELHGPRPSLECLCGPEGAERLGGQLGGDSSAGARQCRRSDREQMWPRWPAGGRWQGYALRPRAAVPARQTSARLRRQRSGQRDRIQAVAAYGLIWPPDRRACAARRHAPSPARAPVPVAPRRRAALVAAIRSWPR